MTHASIRSRLHVFSLIAPIAVLAACSSAPDPASQSASEDALSGAAKRAVTDRIKQLAAAEGLTNPLLVAGVANGETGLAHCLKDYGGVACAGPASQSCGGGAVLAGGGDGACSSQQGGLGMFQFDAGTYSQTIAAYGSQILDLDGDIRTGLDTVVRKVQNCYNTPDFHGNKSEAIAWMNTAKPGTGAYDTFMASMAICYNGCDPNQGCGNFQNQKAYYRASTDALVNEFGSAYWNGGSGGGGGGGGVRCTAGGKYCGSGHDDGGKSVGLDPNKLYTCNGAGNGFDGGAACDMGCATFSQGEADRCIQKSANWSCANSHGNDGKQYWTCNTAANGFPNGDGNVYRCVGAQAETVRCDASKGCHSAGVDHDDSCN